MAIDLKTSTNRKEWERMMPDSRVRNPRHIFGPAGYMEEVFCVNCGRNGGHVTSDWATHVFYLCNNCADTHGRLTLPEIPEGTVRGGQ